MSIVQVAAGVLLILGGVGFLWYARHALAAISKLRALRAERRRLTQDIDRLDAGRRRTGAQKSETER